MSERMVNKTHRSLGFYILSYNNGKYIRDLLDCIKKETAEIKDWEFTICISDNASTDNTAELVRDFCLDWSGDIFFNENNENVGFRRNIVKLWEMSCTDYSWLLGDDLIASGGVACVLKVIESSPHVDLFIANRYLCDVNMNILQEQDYLRIRENKCVNIANKEELLEYLNLCQSVDGLGCFFSSWIMKADLTEYLLRYVDDIFMQNMFTHVYALFSLVSENIPIKIQYLCRRIVMGRAGNTSVSVSSCRKYLDLLAIPLYLRLDHEVIQAFHAVCNAHYHEDIRDEILRRQLSIKQRYLVSGYAGNNKGKIIVDTVNYAIALWWHNVQRLHCVFLDKTKDFALKGIYNLSRVRKHYIPNKNL